METKRRTSRKRDAILNAIRSTSCHPTAEWIYDQLKHDFPDISLGTVYRNIAVFRQEGKIISVGTVDGQERFDGNTLPHAHFVCTHCGRILDLVIPDGLENAISEAVKVLPYQTEFHSLSFFGTCGECCSTEENQ